MQRYVMEVSKINRSIRYANYAYLD
uniref:Uncharacterized protein n=1 Tax=Lepeophtheirus salmonis TaxID=72036 RepID=A0A0K2T6Z9_LEPSM